ncbi:hypothetical protein BDW68DRAFT_49059 [Aspergillus falconensis]
MRTLRPETKMKSNGMVHKSWSGWLCRTTIIRFVFSITSTSVLLEPNGSILIISRLLKLPELGKSFPLHTLDSTHATQLLLRSTGFSQHVLGGMKTIDRGKYVPCLDNQTSDKCGCRRACRISRRPATGYQSRRSIFRETGMSFGKYLQCYRESWHTLQSQSSSDRHYEQGNILQTCLVSYQKVTKRDPEAAEFMLELAHFDSQDIWFELLQCVAYSPDRPKWYGSFISDELAFRTKMRLLL